MVSKAMRQIILIGVICLGTVGMFNAMSSIGNAGKHSPTAQNLAITSSSIAYIVGFLIAGGIHNMLGPRPCVAFGGLTFFLYAGAMYLAKDDERSIYPPLAGVLLGLGAGVLWVTQGAMMMSYPTEDNKGKYISVFWAIFNFGAVLGSCLSFALNSKDGMDPDDVSYLTYIVYMVIMGLVTLLSIFLVRPSSIVRDNGEPVIVAKFAGVQAEFVAILAVFCDWRMLLLIPAFFFSNFSYTYQFNDFNGYNFNIRTRSLNSIFFWLAQMIGALVIGYLLDRLPMKRPKRALLGLGVIALLFMGTWIGALHVQLKHKWERGLIKSSDLIDYEHLDSYPGPLAIYSMFGFCDAAFAVYCYWLMGALSNKHDELSRYAGFFKAIQSLGSAVAAPLDLAGTPFLYYLITNWILCGVSIAAMFLVARTITDTTIEKNDADSEYDDDDEYDEYDYDYDESSSYYTRSSIGGETVATQHHRPSLANSNSTFDENLSTICADSDGSKSRSRSKSSDGFWRSNSRDYDEKDLENNCSSPHRHDSYTSTVSKSSKRTSNSVGSSNPIVDTTTCPSPTLQGQQHQARKGNTRHSRVPPMVEIQKDGSYDAQQPSRSSPISRPNPAYIPSITLMMDSGSNLRSGIEPSSQWANSSSGFTFSHETSISLSDVAQPQQESCVYPPWTIDAPTNFDNSQGMVGYSAPPYGQNNMFLDTPMAGTSSASAAPRNSFGGVSSSGSKNYDEEQDMDSIDTCSISSMSSGHDSIPEMSEMEPNFAQRTRRIN